MAEEIVETVEMVMPIIEPIIEEVIVPELEYTYQPKDESGRPLGGKQVIKYKTQDELAGKLVEQNTLLIRKLREQTRKNRLGQFDETTVPDTATHFSKPVEFKPRQLNAEERMQLSRDLMDPDKFEEASATMFEATMGAKPEELRNTISELQSTNVRILAKTESDAFMANNPPSPDGTKGYYPCKENYEAVTNLMLKNDLSPTRENFQWAYETLDADGIIVRAVEPVKEPVVEIVEPVVETPVVPVVTPTVAAPPSGFIKGQASTSGVPVRKEAYTLAEINKMSADDYKRNYHDPKFRDLVDRLEQEAAAKRSQRK